MPHPLEVEYGLTAHELLDAIVSRFRLKVAVEGAVAEVHLRKKLEDLKAVGVIESYEEHDVNGFPDFTVSLAAKVRAIRVVKGGRPLRVECKNVRDDDYRKAGSVVAYRAEVQKTRAAKGDPTSRYYDVGYFDILAVCLGKKTGNWSDFRYAKAEDLVRHEGLPNKLAVMQRVPLPGSGAAGPWFNDLRDLLSTL